METLQLTNFYKEKGSWTPKTTSTKHYQKQILMIFINIFQEDLVHEGEDELKNLNFTY